MLKSSLTATSGTARTCALVASLITLSVSPLAGAEPPRSDLIVHAHGFAHERGQAIANLFLKGDDIFAKPAARITARIHQGRAEMIFRRLPHGNYAVTVFHDENGNNELDHNFLRLPAEPLGFSNGFSLSVFSGMPSFEKLRFAFETSTKPVEISVK